MNIVIFVIMSTVLVSHIVFFSTKTLLDTGYPQMIYGALNFDNTQKVFYFF